jgi:hypothetical protein
MNTDTQATPTTQQQPLPDQAGIKDLFEALLRRPRELALHKTCDEGATLVRFGIIAASSILIFGIVLGSFSYGQQLWAAPLKLGVGLLFAGFICFPSLYIFSSLAGSGASMLRMAGLLAGMLALSGLLLLGFAPAIWIFAQSTSSFGFMGFLAVSSWLIALAFAFRFLKLALRETGATQSLPLLVWITIFLLVTLQLSTTLRPILGQSDRFLATEKKFFLQHWGETCGKTLKAAAPKR